MNRQRDWILEWAARDRVTDVRQALALAGATPDRAGWRTFVSALTLWLGAVMLAASVGFFTAYNWQALGRFGKFGLLQGLLVIAMAVAAAAGLEKTAGKVAVLVASALVGTLLALIGQTYQTGADPYELFAIWAALILPWAAISRLPALWVLLVALLNLAVVLYFRAFHGLFDALFGGRAQLWSLFALNSGALLLWEAFARSGAEWLRPRWPARLVATAGGVVVTVIAIEAIGKFRLAGTVDGIPLAAGGAVYGLWVAATYAYYRYCVRDLYMLAGGVLSGIVVIAVALSRWLFAHMDASGALLIGLVVIGLSAAGAQWLRSLAREEES